MRSYGVSLIFKDVSSFASSVKSFKLEIKILSTEHLDALVELDRICFNGLWSREAYLRELESSTSNLMGLFSPIYPLQLLGIGCFWSILEEAHITILAVHPQHQNQGLGQMLLCFLLQKAYKQGLERATLEVRASNLAAISLYQKFGFKTAGRRRRYYIDNGEDALILWLGDLKHTEFQKTLDNWQELFSDRLKKSNWEIFLEK